MVSKGQFVGLDWNRHCYSVYFWLISSFIDPAFTGGIFVCGPLHHHVLLSKIMHACCYH